MIFYYIVNARIPTEKAHGLQISKVCEKIASQGVSVELILPDRGNQIKEDLYSFYNVQKNFLVRYLSIPNFIFTQRLISSKVWFYMTSLFFLIKLLSIKLEKESIVYTRNPEIAFIFSLKGHKVFYNAHTLPSRNIFLFKKMLSLVAGIVSNSSGLKEDLQHLGFTNIVAIPNGVDLINSIKQDKEKIFSRFGIKNTDTLILYTGALFAWKGISTLVALAKEMPNFVFMLVGGSDSDVEKWKIKTSSDGVKNIIFTGYVRHVYISEMIASADVLVLPNIPISLESEKYTSPIKLFEYMNSGTPIVASTMPSIQEILSSDAGYFAVPSDVKSFKDAIISALNGPDKEIKTRKAKQDVAQYTWDSHAINLLKFCNS